MYLFHTYLKKKVEFKPITPGKVGMYNCGPTVYYYPTIGNLRAFVFDDILRRSFEYLGYQVTQVMNITDVGHLTQTEAKKELVKIAGGDGEITDDEEGLDRLEKSAKVEGVSVWDVANKYIQAIFGSSWNDPSIDQFNLDGDLGKMNIKKPQVICRATDYVEQQIALIKKLEEKGFIYTTSQAVYFDITKFPRYEELTGQLLADRQIGERANTSDPDRKHPADFRLWQLNQPEHTMQWDSPWGRGFPGWHIECSAMSTQYLGQPFDIHTGGEDHIKVHHVNEMAQSESAFDCPMANYWMHNAFLLVDGKRMGKSLGNMYTLVDLAEKGFEPLDLRYFFLTASYRAKQNFTWEGLQAARSARLGLEDRIRSFGINGEGKIDTRYKDTFIACIEDDLSAPKALAVTWDLVKDTKVDPLDKRATLLDFDRVFGLNLDKVADLKAQIDIPEEVLELVSKREQARAAKDWVLSDQLRDQIEQLGFEVKDSKQGSEVVKK